MMFDKNAVPTIISNGSASEEIYDRMKADYRSPTIGIWFYGDDYFEFIKDVLYYISCPLVEDDSGDVSCPVGVLTPDDGLHRSVRLNFSGYASFAEAADVWQKRCALVDPDNIFIIWEFEDDNYDCSWIMKLFSVLPGRTAALTHTPHPELRNGTCICRKDGSRDLGLFDYKAFLSSGSYAPPEEGRGLDQDQKNFLWQFNETGWLKKLRARNRNMDPTIISGNCAAGFIYHNLGLRFNSPTINLWLNAKDYFALAANLKGYAQSHMEEVTDEEAGCPVGRLIPRDESLPAIKLYFQHYHSYEDARDKWFERYSRINYDNLYFIQEFYNIQWDEQDYVPIMNSLPGKAIALLHKPDPRFKHSVVISGGSEDGSEFPSGYIFEHDGISGKRYMDKFDYTSFLNG